MSAPRLSTAGRGRVPVSRLPRHPTGTPGTGTTTRVLGLGPSGGVVEGRGRVYCHRGTGGGVSTPLSGSFGPRRVWESGPCGPRRRTRSARRKDRPSDLRPSQRVPVGPSPVSPHGPDLSPGTHKPWSSVSKRPRPRAHTHVHSGCTSTHRDAQRGMEKHKDKGTEAHRQTGGHTLRHAYSEV